MWVLSDRNAANACNSAGQAHRPRRSLSFTRCQERSRFATGSRVESATSNRTMPPTAHTNLHRTRVASQRAAADDFSFATAFLSCTNWRISSENKLYSFFLFICLSSFAACVPMLAWHVKRKIKKNFLEGHYLLRTLLKCLYVAQAWTSCGQKIYIYMYMYLKGEKKRSHPIFPSLDWQHLLFPFGLPGRSHTSSP